MFRPLYIFLFNVLGWQIEGEFPKGIRKHIVAIAPHTSNWDFTVGVMVRSILRVRNSHFLGKHTLFRPPFGWFFRWLGGYPVDRSKNSDVVQQVIDIFNQHDDLIIALAPEGTRKKVTNLKTGFYHIAKGANIPIIPVGLDFSKKRVVISKPFYPTDNQEKDFMELTEFYRTIRGKNPEFGID